MKALLLKRYGNLDQLYFDDIPRPQIKADEILVRIYAAGLNPIDTMIPKGMFKPILKFKLPMVMGSDLTGIVEEVGAQVTRFKAGDAVFASVFDLHIGSFAEYVAVPEHAASLKPESLGFVEAASLPMVALASWQAFTERAKIEPADKVFIPAGAGGIGTFAIQLAKHLGATVATTTSTGNIDLVRDLGADYVVDYKNQRFEEILSNYDVVLGTLRGDEIARAMKIVKSGGKVISLIGPPDVKFARKRGMNALMRGIIWLLSAKIIRLAEKNNIDYSFLFIRSDGKQLEEIARLVDAGNIRPIIDKTFPFERTKSALEYLARGHAKGKVVITIVEP
ncbi:MULTISPECIES: NADP-dependent oxidoreductase [unclassified Raoultella]